MKKTIYITKDKLVYSGQVYQWNKDTLVDVLKKIKETGANWVRVVLGNEVSFMGTAKIQSGNLTRPDFVKEAAGLMPFVITNENVDRMKVVMGEGDEWWQIAAIPSDLQNTLSIAFKAAGIKVEALLPVGALIMREVANRTAPVLVEWRSEVENILVVVISGLVVFVASGDETEMINYVRSRWNLAVNPEKVSLRKFDWEKRAWEERVRGSDEIVMSLNLLHPSDLIGLDEVLAMTKEEESRGKTGTRNGIIIGLLMVLIGATVFGGYKMWRSSNTVKITPMTIPVSPTPTLVITPTEEVINWANLTAIVTNGSGVAGEAALVRDQLIPLGMKTIDVGNSTISTGLNEIRVKSNISAKAIQAVKDLVPNLNLADGAALTSGDKYDLMIVVTTVK